MSDTVLPQLSKGDVVLFAPSQPQPVPRGTLRMYTIGFVASATATLVILTDICGCTHAAYRHQVRVIHHA